MKTSRVAWILTYKKEPKNWALHCCPTGSNGNCCNPTHLYDGTAKQNTADCIREGRYKNGSTLHPETRARGARHGSKTHPDRVAKGERAGSAKLSNWDVMVIRKVYAAGRHRMKRLGEVFGVSASQICLIVNRRSRKAG